jgi:hypothetical protein
LIAPDHGSRIWLFLLLAVSPTAAIGLFLLAAVYAWGFPQDRVWRTIVLFFIPCLAAPILLTLTRRLFARLSIAFQAVIAFLVLLIIFPMIVWFLLEITR